MKNIDDFFKEELGSYAELPPPPAWGALEKRLDEEKKRRVFPFRWFWFVGLVAILGIAGYSVAWKVSATRDLAAGYALPTAKKYPAAASIPGNTPTATINNQPKVEGANSTGNTKTIATTDTKTKHIATTTTKRKHNIHQLALASSRNKKISKKKEAALKHIIEEKENTPATVKTEKSRSQYPDEDYYEGATASIAPTPVETSAPAGYTVNKRKKNNMLVADMSPKEDPSAHYYAAATVETEASNSEPAAVTSAQTSATHTVRKHTTTSRSIARQSKPATKAQATKEQAKLDDDKLAATVAAKATPNATAAKQPKRSNPIAIAKAKKPAIAADMPVSAAVSNSVAKHNQQEPTTVAAVTPKPTGRIATKDGAKETGKSKTSAIQTIAVKPSAEQKASKPSATAAATGDNKESSIAKTSATQTVSAKTTAEHSTSNPAAIVAATAKPSASIAATTKENKTAGIEATATSAQVTGTKKVAVIKKHKADAPSVASTTTASVDAATPKSLKAKPATISATPTTELASSVSGTNHPTTAPASTSVLASSAPAKKHTKDRSGAVPAATNSMAAATKQVTGTKATKTPTAKETAPVAPVAGTAASAKPAKEAIAMKSGSKKATVTTPEETAKAENSAAIQPGSESLATAAPKAKHGKKAHSAVVSKDDAITSVAAITGTQPAKKAAKTTGKPSSLVNTNPVPAAGENLSPADEAGAPVKEIAGASAKVAKAKTSKGQPKAAGKAAQPATNTYAAAAKTAGSQPVSRSGSTAKTSGGNLSRFNDEEVPTEDPTINTAANNTLAAAKKEEPVPGTFKEKTPPADQLPVTKKEEAKPQTDSPAVAAKNRNWEAGIKGGFEGSYNGNAARKIVISPYFDYKFNDKFSIMVQPAFKAASLNTRSLGGAQTYYSIDHTDSTLSATNIKTSINPWGGFDTVGVSRTYQYSQTHSAITKGYSIGGSYYEFELPLLFKYAVTPKLAMYAGININYSRAIRISEHTYTSAPIQVNGMVTQFTPSGQPVEAPPSVSSVLPISGNPISAYTGPLYTTPDAGLFRFGYMAGLSYEFRKNWMVDALVQQGFTKTNNMGGYDVNKPLTLPYIRLTLGYKLIK